MKARLLIASNNQFLIRMFNITITLVTPLTKLTQSKILKKTSTWGNLRHIKSIMNFFNLFRASITKAIPISQFNQEWLSIITILFQLNKVKKQFNYFLENQRMIIHQVYFKKSIKPARNQSAQEENQRAMLEYLDLYIILYLLF